MIGGKKIQNFITFQTKQTIFLKQNQPQLIVHQQTIETDSFKQLLSTKRSRQKLNPFQDRNEYQQNHELRKSKDHRKSHITSSNSKSKNTSKERSASYKNRLNNEEHIPMMNRVKQFDLKYDTKRSRSNKNKLSKKVKSMIRLPKLVDKNLFDFEKSKICRKSYSPNRNYSEGIKRTSNNNNYSTQCIKTTKFTQSKENTSSKHMKSVKKEKKNKKDSLQTNKNKGTKSKEKLKSHYASTKNINEAKNYNTERRKEEEIFNRIDAAQKNKKIPKKVSPSKKTETLRKKTQQTATKQTKQPKQKLLPKKRKSMSKSKKNLHHFGSVDEMVFRHEGYQTARNQTTALSNYLSSRDSFKKKVKTDRDSFNKPKKKSQVSSRQKQTMVSSKNLKRLQNGAATRIQKVYKGYITRKWLRQYLRIISAAVVVQKHWRGYMQRRIFNKMKGEQKLKVQKSRIIARVDPIVIESNEIHFLQYSSKMNIDKWKDILFEVMSEQTVNEALKSRIKNFLQHEGESARGSIVSQMSQRSHRSQRSHNSEQKLQQQIDSQRRFFQKKHHKKEQLSLSGQKRKKYLQSPQSFYIDGNDRSFIDEQSPSSRRLSMRQSQVVSQMVSPQSTPISPKLQKSQSPQRIVSNLQEISHYQRKNIILEAESRKRQLQQLLEMNALTPQSYQRKQRQVDNIMEKSLKMFEDSMKGVIQSCKKSSQGVEIHQVNSLCESVMMTPENSQVKDTLVREELLNLSQDQVKSRLFERAQVYTSNAHNDLTTLSSQKATQLNPTPSTHLQPIPLTQPLTYQNFQTFNINAFSSQTQKQQQKQKQQQITQIDTSCQFLDQYLLTMIQYLRNKSDGKVMTDIVRGVKTVRNLSAYTVLRNLAIVKEENSMEEDGFCLPLYKYLQDDTDILKPTYVQDYNKYFNMMKSTHKFQPTTTNSNKSTPPNQPLQHYMKLLVDSFNQALNIKRPSTYIFTDHSIESFNSTQVIQRQQYDLQSQYDMYCATAMQEIFTWFNVKYGCIVSADAEEEASLEQVITQNASRLQQMMKMEVEKKWDQYYERIETLAKIAEEMFDQLILKETITLLNVKNNFLRQNELIN